MKEALISGAMGYIGGGGTIMGANPLEAVGKYLPGAVGGALNTGLATGVIGAGIGKLGGMSTEDALKMGLVSGASAGAMKAFGGMSQAEYDVKSKILTLAEAGSPEALALHDAGDLGNMKAFLKENPDLSLRISEPAAGGTTAPGPVGPVGPVGTAVENLPSSRLGAAPNTDMARLTSTGGNAGGGLRPPAMSPAMSYDPATSAFKADYSIQGPAIPGGGAPTLNPSTFAAPGLGAAAGGVRRDREPREGLIRHSVP
jgi:hypothetical protein